MALRDDVRAGKGRDAALNDRLKTALVPDRVGPAPDFTGSWDAIMDLMETLPGVRYRIGASRLGVLRKGETQDFECAITTDDGSVRFAPVARKDLPGDIDNKRVVLEAILIAKGL